MTDPPPGEPSRAAADPQPLAGFLSNAEWDALLARIDRLVQRMDALPDGEVKNAVFELLDGIDALHREALSRLVRLFKEGVLEKVVSDPAIHTLMELYDLLPESVAEEAARPASRFPIFTLKVAPAAPQAKPQRYPHWVPVLRDLAALASGDVAFVTADDVDVLLCRRDDAVFALEPRCAQDGASLAGATLAGYTLTCPHHGGCHYDVRQGTRIGGGPALRCYPVNVEAGGRVSVGLDMDFTPALPSF